MKKITLMLCACAMAFAGLLVSCSNGSEKIIFTDSTSYDYAYTVSGSKVVTTEVATADKAVLLTTTTKTSTFSTGAANISWSENDDATYDWKNYELNVMPGRGDYVESVKYSGTSASAQPATVDQHKDNTEITLLDWNDWDVYSKLNDFDFYSLGDAYYLGSKSDDNSSYAAKTEDEIKDLNVTVAVTGNIAEDDKLTIVYTVTAYDNGTDPVVNKKTAVYTFNLVKAGSAE